MKTCCSHVFMRVRQDEWMYRYSPPIYAYTNKNLTLPPLKTLDLGSPVITSIFVEGNTDPQQVFGSLGTMCHTQVAMWIRDRYEARFPRVSAK